ncbi:GNAT family N-acetyltransferase [Kitasatospora sp. NPDC094019]|uniref:GNAT family N-acetyltransferase n=1 Tax=Kitasatospora sp. NPDC094019 TaxID=3364091 RepID=UPI0037FA5E90
MSTPTPVSTPAPVPTPAPEPTHTRRPATRRDLPAVLALLADEDRVVDPATVVVTEAYEHAFRAIDDDPRNELLVLADADGTVVGCLRATCIPGLGKGGAERSPLEAVRIRADRRGGGLGRVLMALAIDRARSRGCARVQLTSDRRRGAAHRCYAGLGFTRSHDGFKLALRGRCRARRGHPPGGATTGEHRASTGGTRGNRQRSDRFRPCRGRGGAGSAGRLVPLRARVWRGGAPGAGGAADGRRANGRRRTGRPVPGACATARRAPTM